MSDHDRVVAECNNAFYDSGATVVQADLWDDGRTRRVDKSDSAIRVLFKTICMSPEALRDK